MLNEFYKYIANNTIGFFQSHQSAIRPGERYCLRLDTEEMLGCVIKNFDERTISMNPLHPLNVLYQLTLLEEESVGEVRDNLIEKLSALYLLPYIKDADKALYHAIEQRHSPEWRIYAQLANKRYQGARNFVQKLVCDKISQYIDHFTFLFDDLGNDMFCINLVNMGDCREVLQGLILFYSKELNKEVAPENLMLKLYFFDGEKIADYFLGNKEVNIRDALMVLSGNDTFDILYDQVKRVLKISENAQSDVAHEYLTAQAEIEEYQQQVQDLQQEIESIQDSIEKLTAEIECHKKEYSDHGGITVEEWTDLHNQLKAEEEKRERLNWQRKALADGASVRPRTRRPPVRSISAS